MGVEIIRHQFTVDEYHRMGEAGILREDDPVGLIEREVAQITPIGTRHARSVKRIIYFFTTRLRRGARARLGGGGRRHPGLMTSLPRLRPWPRTSPSPTMGARPCR